MILFGGYDGSLQYNDTWAYDPATNTWPISSPAVVCRPRATLRGWPTTPTPR